MYTEKIERKYRLGPIRVPETRFAIVGNARTGSSYLGSLLDSHPDIACWDDEPFQPGEAFDRSGCESPATFLTGTVFNVNAKAVGFKLLWDAMVRLPNSWKTLADLEIAVVHTWRRNRLDSLISLELATLNNAFTSHSGTYDVRSVELEYRRCQRWFELSEKRDQIIDEEASEHSVRKLSLEYHELCRDQTRLLDFLEVPRCPLSSRLKKQRSGSQSAIVRNYAELKRHFSETRWAEFFED